MKRPDIGDIKSEKCSTPGGGGRRGTGGGYFELVKSKVPKILSFQLAMPSGEHLGVNWGFDNIFLQVVSQIVSFAETNDA